jgi:NitT/TauT family transport system ATP-binding protein
VVFSVPLAKSAHGHQSAQKIISTSNKPFGRNVQVASVPVPDSMAVPANAVELENIGVSFPERRGGAFVAVESATLTVREGEFVAIVGPTGCGKSTLLNVAAGLLKPSGGKCRVGGAPVSGINRQAGYLFQADALMPWKTAIENVAIGLEVRGTPREQACAEAATWLSRVGLRAFHDRYPHQLSGGQRKRVSLAQVLILRPKLLLMDEPFGPLDAQTRAIMGELLLDLWSADRKAVMFVTHDLEEAIALADRVVIMSAGPGATIIGDHTVPLARPRDITESRHLPGFVETHKVIWQQLKAEVVKTYAESVHA